MSTIKSTIKDAAARAADRARFLTESPASRDFGKSWDDWRASKRAARTVAPPPRRRSRGR